MSSELLPQAETRAELLPPRQVVVFVLRRAIPRTLCRVAPDDAGHPLPIVVPVAPGESETDAVRAAISGLAPDAVYATGAPPVRVDATTANSFVAIVEDPASGACDADWLTLADAVRRFPCAELRRAGREVLQRFVRRSPDEALRVF